MGVAQHVDDVVHGAGVREGGRGELDDVGEPPAGLVQRVLPAVARDVRDLLGGVADDADDPAGAARLVAADVALGVRPAQRAVAAAQPEVGAVVLAAVLHGLGDDGVDAAALRRRHPQRQRLGAPVELLRAQVEHLVGLGVHVEQTGVQVPVEAAHAVERQDRVRVGGPVVRE